MKLVGILVLTLVLPANIMGITAAAAEPVPDVRVNGEYIKTCARPFIDGGTMFAPVRSVAEAIGAESVQWDDRTKQATVTRKGKSVFIDAKSEKGVRIVNDRVFAPVRYIAERLGGSVRWDGRFADAELTFADIKTNKEHISDIYDRDRLFWLARIINAESGAEPFAGQVAVGHVVLNRVKDSKFPDTVWGVIFDDRYSVQFEPVINGTVYNDPAPQSITAAKTAYLTESSIADCMYFYAPEKSASNWISENREYYTTIGGHDFYR